MVYLCFGALMFSLMEAPGEKNIRKELYDRRMYLMFNAACVSGNGFVMHVFGV